MPTKLAPERTRGEGRGPEDRRGSELLPADPIESDLSMFSSPLWPPDHGRVLDRTSRQTATRLGSDPASEEPRAPLADRAVLDEVVHELGRQPRAVVEALARALRETREQDPLDAGRWGPPPDDVAYLEATYEAARAQALFEDTVAEHSETVEQAAERLSVAPVAVVESVQAGALLGIERGGELLLPTWQFSDRTLDGLLPGLAAVRGSFPGDGLALTSWVHEANDALGGRTPRDCLEAGETEAVVPVADAIGA